MITPDDLCWISDNAARPRVLACPVCAAMGPHVPVLDAPSMSPPHAMLTFLRCPGCGSGFFDPPGITSFTDLGQNGEEFWRFYVEVGGGVWETIWPILADKGGGRRTLLDIGCGFGFAVDYWRRAVGGEAIGVELASYGQVGARMLGITVYDRLLQDIPELAGRRFDVVYASEVIEHVPDPVAFIELLARHVADEGMLVLTTPSAAFIRPANHSSTLHAALSPGFHGFLLSESAFADAVRRNGFTHVDVRQFNERQILWASRAPLDVDPSPARTMPGFESYLAAHVAEFDGASPVWQGFAYRAVKIDVNASRFAAAGAVANRLLGAISASFGPYVRDPDQIVARLRECGSLADAGAVMPYFLPSLYFYLAAVAQYVDRDLARAERLFHGAVDSTIEACRFGSIFFLDAISLIWPARMALADIQLVRGDFSGGAQAYAQIAAAGGLCLRQDGYAIAGPDIVEVRVPLMVEQLFTHGQVAAAATVFSGYQQYIARHYGDALLNATGVDEALVLGAAPVPLDPLLAPSFAAVLSHKLTGSREESLRQLSAVADIADKWSRHPRWGLRMQEHARRARWLLPPPTQAAKTAWSFDMTYKLPK